MLGMWKQKELWDGTYTFKDLLDIHELLEVQHENKRRAYEYELAISKGGGQNS